MTDYLEIVDLFIAVGANKVARNIYNLTPFQQAYRKNPTFLLKEEEKPEQQKALKKLSEILYNQ